MTLTLEKLKSTVTHKVIEKHLFENVTSFSVYSHSISVKCKDNEQSIFMGLDESDTLYADITEEKAFLSMVERVNAAQLISTTIENVFCVRVDGTNGDTDRIVDYIIDNETGDGDYYFIPYAQPFTVMT